MNKQHIFKLKEIVKQQNKKILKMVGSSLNKKDITFQDFTKEKLYLEKFLEVLYVIMPFKIQTYIKKEEFIHDYQLGYELIKTK